jgi:hypothetical protein
VSLPVVSNPNHPVMCETVVARTYDSFVDYDAIYRYNARCLLGLNFGRYVAAVA